MAVYTVTTSDVFSGGELDCSRKIEEFLEQPQQSALLTLEERNLPLISSEAYLSSIWERTWIDSAMSESPVLDLSSPRGVRLANIEKAKTREAKRALFTDRIVTATWQVDIARSLFRAATGKDFVPVDDVKDETVAIQYGCDMLEALLEGMQVEGIYRSAAFGSVKQKLISGFEQDQSKRRYLAVLCGKNAVKKAGLWTDQLLQVTDNLKKANCKRTFETLVAHNETRNIEYVQRFDPVQLLADKVRSYGDT